MNLDEAIQHAEEVAAGCGPCADQHRQLATWLRELRDRQAGRFAHWPLSCQLQEQMLPWAREIAARYGRPVYLCGSALELPKPRDVDVRIILTDREFRDRWGDHSWDAGHENYRAYAADVGKLGRDASRWMMLNLDVQVQPLCVALKYAGQRRLRLDDVAGILDAGADE